MSDSGSNGRPRQGGLRQWFIKLAVIFILLTAGTGWLFAQNPTNWGPPTHLLWGISSLFLVLLLVSGLVSSSETALFSLDRLDVSHLKKSNHLLDRTVLLLLGRPNDTLITILILNNSFNIAISLATATFMRQIFPQAPLTAFLLAALVAITGILVAGEILPKILANLHPLGAARLLAPPLAILTWILGPIRFVINLLLKLIFRLLRIPDQSPEEEVTEEELKVMISSGEVSSVLEEDEREMIDGVFELRHTVAAEIMTPRMSVDSISDDLTQQVMLARLRQMHHNRVLVYHESPEQLVGFVLVKEVLLNEQEDWRTHLRKLLFVPERIGLLDLLKTLREQRTKLAVVVDEYGGMAGIVTLKDLLEEVVGDIYEKHEINQSDLQQVAEDRWRASGSLDITMLGDELHVNFPTSHGRTLGGFIMNTLGRIPAVDDMVPHEGLELRVERMANRRVLSVLVQRALSPAEHDGRSPGEAAS